MMNRLSRIQQQSVFVICCVVALFILNNILLGSIVPRMPGGSATGITTMFVVTYVSLVIKRFGCIPAMYLIYELIGFPSHLAIGDWQNLMVILLFTLAALIFDGMLYRGHYRIAAYIVAFPVFVAVTKTIGLGLSYYIYGQDPISNIQAVSIALSVLLGYAGIILAYAGFKRTRDSGFITKLTREM